MQERIPKSGHRFSGQMRAGQYLSPESSYDPHAQLPDERCAGFGRRGHPTATALRFAVLGDGGAALNCKIMSSSHFLKLTPARLPNFDSEARPGTSLPNLARECRRRGTAFPKARDVFSRSSCGMLTHAHFLGAPKMKTRLKTRLLAEFDSRPYPGVFRTASNEVRPVSPGSSISARP